jgi:organic radical activating enzyme
MSKTLKIMIYITDKCNMNCSYCYNKFPRDNKDIDMVLLLKYIDDVYKKTKRNIDILLIGGEPSLYKNIHEFIIECRKRIFISDIDFFTNFSRGIDFYKLLIKNKVNLVCSWHNETDDNEFSNKLNSLTNDEKKFIVEIAMMFEHNNIDRWNNVISQVFKKYKNVIQPWILYDRYTTKEYT